MLTGSYKLSLAVHDPQVLEWFTYLVTTLHKTRTIEARAWRLTSLALPCGT